MEMGKTKSLNHNVLLGPVYAPVTTKRLLDYVKAQFTVVPNVFRVLGNASVSLEGYLNFSAALHGGTFDARVREQIALTVAARNLCGHCLSAHARDRGSAQATAK